MEKECHDNAEAASSTGSSGQSDLSFEKIGDADALQESFVTPELTLTDDCVTGGLPSDGAVLPPDTSMPSDFSIISDSQKSENDALQTSGQFFLPDADTTSSGSEHSVVEVVSEPSQQEARETELLSTDTTASQPSPGEDNTTKDITTSSYDVIKSEPLAGDSSSSQSLTPTSDKPTSDLQGAGDTVVAMQEGQGQQVVSKEKGAGDVAGAMDVNLDISEKSESIKEGTEDKQPETSQATPSVTESISENKEPNTAQQ